MFSRSGRCPLASLFGLAVSQPQSTQHTKLPISWAIIVANDWDTMVTPSAGNGEVTATVFGSDVPVRNS